MEELVSFPVLQISSARQTILNHRWELFCPHNERKWLEEAMPVQGGRFHRLHLRSLLVNLCLIKRAQSWKKDYADGKQIRSGEVVARLHLECWPARSSGQFLGNVEEKSWNNFLMLLHSPVWLCWPSKTEAVNPDTAFCPLQWQLHSSAALHVLSHVFERAVDLIKRLVFLKSRLQASQNKHWCYLGSWCFSKSRRCPRTRICSWCLPEMLVSSIWMSGEKGGERGERPWRGNNWEDTNENSIKQKRRKTQSSIDALLKAADASWFHL